MSFPCTRGVGEVWNQVRAHTLVLPVYAWGWGISTRHLREGRGPSRVRVGLGCPLGCRIKEKHMKKVKYWAVVDEKGEITFMLDAQNERSYPGLGKRAKRSQANG